MTFPAVVAFDLSDVNFNRQLSRLAAQYPQLFEKLSRELEAWSGEPWDEFTKSCPMQLFEAAFDASYVIVKLLLLDGELQLIAHLRDGVLVLVGIHKPPFNN
jgi:hypothetical protein